MELFVCLLIYHGFLARGGWHSREHLLGVVKWTNIPMNLCPWS
jgi:hypothetical protein